VIIRVTCFVMMTHPSRSVEIPLTATLPPREVFFAGKSRSPIGFYQGIYDPVEITAECQVEVVRGVPDPVI
jgi:hypothetical protein